MKQLTCVIQARIGGGTRLPGKMIKPFAGSSLFEILLKKLSKCSTLNRNQIFLSLCEEELIKIGEKYDYNIYHRDQNSIDESYRNQPLVHLRRVYSWVYDIKSDFFLMINACNPLLKPETIDKAVRYFQENEINSLFSVIKKNNFYWDKQGQMLSKYQGPKSESEYFYHFGTQWVEEVYEAAHSIYIFNTEYFMKNNMHRFGFKKNDPYLFEVNPLEAFDIDYQWQFELAEALYLNQKKETKNYE